MTDTVVGSTLNHLANRFNLDLSQKSPIRITQVNRVIMAQVLAKLNLNYGVEVGVAEGLHAKVLCDINPNLKLYGIDLYAKYPGYEEYANPEDCYKQAQERLKGKNFEFIKAYSMDAVGQFEDNSLDFVFIDGGHDFKNIAMDIVEWSKKVKPGGIVYGHDYKRTSRHSRNKVDVKDVVDAYMYAMGINPWFVLTDDIKNQFFGQDNPCWLYIKQ